MDLTSTARQLKEKLDFGNAHGGRFIKHMHYHRRLQSACQTYYVPWAVVFGLGWFTTRLEHVIIQRFLETFINWPAYFRKQVSDFCVSVKKKCFAERDDPDVHEPFDLWILRNPRFLRLGSLVFELLDELHFKSFSLSMFRHNSLYCYTYRCLASLSVSVFSAYFPCAQSRSTLIKLYFCSINLSRYSVTHREGAFIDGWVHMLLDEPKHLLFDQCCRYYWLYGSVHGLIWVPLSLVNLWHEVARHAATKYSIKRVSRSWVHAV